MSWFTDDSKRLSAPTSTGLIAQARTRGCDAVVLGCTEFPLLIGEADSLLPILDSTRILARAALREAARIK
jgi:aspartate racemase